ncbi:MAG: TonB-dependent receptor plug domain-containing protein, partial [Chitinivibrionales bacterium]
FCISAACSKEKETEPSDADVVTFPKDTSQSDHPAMNLDRMVVTASKSSMSADLVVEDVEVATKRQIESGGFFNAMEMLDGILGVDIDPARTQTNIVLNGLKGEYVKILIDGIPFTGNGRRGISSRGRY